jgi:hypothetical protein
VFTDIDCGFCRRLHAQMDDYLERGIRVRYLFFPRSGPHTSSFRKAEAVWCSADAPEDWLQTVMASIGDADAVRAMLAERPRLVEATAPHPQWGGRPQALHLAVERGDRAMFDLLMASGAEAAGRNALYDHWSPLMLAIQWKRDSMRDELLGRVDHVSLIDALMMGDDETALRIMQWGQIMLQRPMPNGATMLHFATTVSANGFSPQRPSPAAAPRLTCCATGSIALIAVIPPSCAITVSTASAKSCSETSSSTRVNCSFAAVSAPM